VDGRSPAAAINLTAATIASARASITGESKNEQPFTRRSADTDALTRFLHQNSHTTTRARLGEPKNEAPFTLHADHEHDPRALMLPGCRTASSSNAPSAPSFRVTTWYRGTAAG
jgi:hypothetical protein